MKQLIWMNLKYQLKNYKLVLVQFAIGFVALLCGCSFLFGIRQKMSSVNRMADKNTYHIFNESSTIQNDTKESLQSLSQLYSRLEGMDGISNVQIFQVDHFAYGKDDKFDIESINGNMINTIQFDISKGSVERLKSYSSDSVNGYLGDSVVIPALVSEKYQDKYPLGSQVEVQYSDIEKNRHTYKFEIVGLLDADMPMWRGNSTDTISNMEMMNPKLIVPFFTEIGSSLPYTFNVLYEIDGSDNVDKVNSDIVKLYNEYGINIKIQNVFEEAEIYFNEQSVLWMYAFGLAFILLFLTELGNIGITLSLLQRRKQEFGIYIAIGMSVYDLKMLNFIGMFIQVVATFIVSIGLYLLVFEGLISNYPYSLDFKSIAVAFGVSFFLNFIVEYALMYRIGKMEPIKLLDSGE